MRKVLMLLLIAASPLIAQTQTQTTQTTDTSVTATDEPTGR
jgi:hypothetical protein